MVKKVTLPPCGSTLGGRPVAPCSALCHRGNPLVVQPLEKAEHFLYLDGFSLDGSARRTPLPLSSGKTRRTESTSTGIPLFTDRTHLSANAFKFGLLAGNSCLHSSGFQHLSERFAELGVPIVRKISAGVQAPQFLQSRVSGGSVGCERQATQSPALFPARQIEIDFGMNLGCAHNASTIIAEAGAEVQRPWLTAGFG